MCRRGRNHLGGEQARAKKEYQRYAKAMAKKGGPTARFIYHFLMRRGG
jgi:hypothetical protein